MLTETSLLGRGGRWEIHVDPLARSHGEFLGLTDHLAVFGPASADLVIDTAAACERRRLKRAGSTCGFHFRAVKPKLGAGGHLDEDVGDGFRRYDHLRRLPRWGRIVGRGNYDRWRRNSWVIG